MSFLDDAISTIGSGLAETAADEIGSATGINVGGVLGTLFGSGQTEGGQNMATLISQLADNWSGSQQQLAMLTTGIQQQQAELLSIGHQLTAIATAVGQISGEIANIEQMLEKIDEQQLYSEWEDVDNQLVEYLAQIDAGFQTYGDYTGTPGTSTTLVTNLANDILNTNTGPKVALNAISAFILDDSQQKGVLQLWSNMVVPLVQQGLLDYREAAAEYIDYYRKLAYAQLRATNLVMEAFNFDGNATLAAGFWNQYRGAILAQETTFITWLVPIVAAGSAVTIVNENYVVTYSASHAATQLNPGIQRLQGNGQTEAYYSPSEIFRAAEELLANLYVTGAGDRRIVVHMLYQSGSPVGPLVGAVQLPLTTPQGGQQFMPTASARLGGPFAYPGTSTAWMDFNFDMGIIPSTFYLKRFVYAQDAGHPTALPDGDYRIVNLNGTNGLIPLETYIVGDTNCPKPAFLDDTVLAYTLHVDGAQRFDFANFLAYNIPLSAPLMES